MKNTLHVQVRWFHLLPALALLALLAVIGGVLGGKALAGAPSAAQGVGTAYGPTQAPTNTPCPRGTPIVFQINIINGSYQPPQAFFPAGNMVRWTNLDNAPHSATSDNNLWDSGPLAQGQSFQFLIQNPGIYNYHDSLNQQLRGLLNVGTPPGCGPPRTGTPPPTPPRTGTPPLTPPRTGTPHGTPPPPPQCRDCHLGILAVTNSCNPMDGTVHWIAIVHNPDRCVVRAPWRAELQIEENGKWRSVRTQFAAFNFPPGDGVVQGVFCFQAAPNVHALRVEFMFENRLGGALSSEIKEVVSEPDRYSDTPGDGTSNASASDGSGKELPCNMRMAARPIPPCPRNHPCPPPPPPPGTPRPTFTPHP